MKREFLDGLGLSKDMIDAIMSEHGSDLQREKSRADQLKAQLDSAQEQIASYDYRNKVSSAVAGMGLKFSSKAAERDFFHALMQKNLQWDDGMLVGFEEFVQDRKSSDPDAFLPDKITPRFISGGDGDGHGAPGGLSMAELMAESIGKAGAARNQTAHAVVANYKGGCFYGA